MKRGAVNFKVLLWGELWGMRSLYRKGKRFHKTMYRKAIERMGSLSPARISLSFFAQNIPTDLDLPGFVSVSLKQTYCFLYIQLHSTLIALYWLIHRTEKKWNCCESHQIFSAIVCKPEEGCLTITSLTVRDE